MTEGGLICVLQINLSNQIYFSDVHQFTVEEFHCTLICIHVSKTNAKNLNVSNQNPNPDLKTKTGNS